MGIAASAKDKQALTPLPGALKHPYSKRASGTDRGASSDRRSATGGLSCLEADDSDASRGFLGTTISKLRWSLLGDFGCRESLELERLRMEGREDLSDGLSEGLSAEWEFLSHGSTLGRRLSRRLRLSEYLLNGLTGRFLLSDANGGEAPLLDAEPEGLNAKLRLSSGRRLFSGQLFDQWPR